MASPHQEFALLTEPCPCTGCRFAPRCAAEHRACARFGVFLSGASERQWMNAPRVATTAIYAALLGDSEDRRRERIARIQAARAKRARAKAHPAQRVA